MKKFLLIISIIFLFVSLYPTTSTQAKEKLWSVQSIDTMKYSRDKAREKLNDHTFDLVIAKQVGTIAKSGATHVAIGTPYDEEFLPFLKRWVDTARRYNLKVWFRGNFAGWEQWFNYPPITRDTHRVNIEKFIKSNSALFQDGDILTSCPECENGGPGDPRNNGDTMGHRAFLVEEHEIVQKAFVSIHKDVISGYYSMNADVARLVMDRETTKSLGGVVVIDHYIASAEQLSRDAAAIASVSGGDVVIGEFGAPIKDIHGNMTEEQQAVWVRESLEHLMTVPSVIGVNYWTSVGGSTEIWSEDGTSRRAVDELKRYYDPVFVSLVVKDPLASAVSGVSATTLGRTYKEGKRGNVVIPMVANEQALVVQAPGYKLQHLHLSNPASEVVISLIPEKESASYKIRKLLKLLFPR